MAEECSCGVEKSLSRRNSLRGPSNLSPARSLRPSGSFGASGSGAAAAGSSGNTVGSMDEQQVARLQVRVRFDAPCESFLPQLNFRVSGKGMWDSWGKF